MNIKFKKMFKTTTLLFVIFVMVFNSFAAISVSDGSAFVTKAEFSADLNNLSNRMSALENSIDAKIDSLVSSYLSRNGIWNGERQTIATNNLGWTGVQASTSDGGYFSYISYPNDSTLQRVGPNKNASYWPLTKASNIGTKVIVSQVTKSGLMLFSYNRYFHNSTGNNGGTTWQFALVRPDNGGIVGDQIGLSIGASLTVSNNSGTVLYTDAPSTPIPIPGTIVT